MRPGRLQLRVALSVGRQRNDFRFAVVVADHRNFPAVLSGEASARVNVHADDSEGYTCSCELVLFRITRAPEEKENAAWSWVVGLRLSTAAIYEPSPTSACAASATATMKLASVAALSSVAVARLAPMAARQARAISSAS